MCISCGCWMDETHQMGGDGNHPENSTVMPNVKTTEAPDNGSSPESNKV